MPLKEFFYQDLRYPISMSTIKAKISVFYEELKPYLQNAHHACGTQAFGAVREEEVIAIWESLSVHL